MDAEAELEKQAGRLLDHERTVLTAPSFLSRTETLARVRREAREQFGRSDAIWAYNGKLQGKRLAEELGIRTPTIYADPAPLDELDVPPHACVVKPVRGASGRGIAPLQAGPQGRWTNLFDLDSGPVTLGAILEPLRAVAATGRISPRFIVEELLPGHNPHDLPLDWKFLCIGGKVALLYGRDPRNQPSPRFSRFRYFDPDWNDVGAVRNPEQVDPSIPLPAHPDELIATAEAIARALPGLFVRVDLWDTPAGVVFGEITPQPGTALWFGPELDRRLGQLWDRAEAATILPPADANPSI